MKLPKYKIYQDYNGIFFVKEAKFGGLFYVPVMDGIVDRDGNQSIAKWSRLTEVEAYIVILQTDAHSKKSKKPKLVKDVY